MIKRNRIAAAVLAVTVLFVMVYSVCFIIANENHECLSDDCFICCQLQYCKVTLKSAVLIVITLFSAFFCRIFIRAAELFAFPCFYGHSLVSLKVKLSD